MYRADPPNLQEDSAPPAGAPSDQTMWRPSRVPEWKSPPPDASPPQRDCQTVVTEGTSERQRFTPADFAAASQQEGRANTSPVHAGQMSDSRGECVVSASDFQNVLSHEGNDGESNVFSVAPPFREVDDGKKNSFIARGEEGAREENRANNVPPAKDDAFSQFQQLRQQANDFHAKLKWNYDQIATLETQHAQEASAYRDAVDAKLSQHKVLLETAQAEVLQSQERVRSLQETVESQARELTASQQELYTLRVQLTRLEQMTRHAEDRARVAEVGRGIAEIRQKEAETAMEHISAYAEGLYAKVANASSDREEAVRRQQSVFEAHRKELILFFDKREAALIGHLCTTATNVYHEANKASTAETEAAVARWKSLYESLVSQYRELEQSTARRKTEAEREWLERQSRLDSEMARQQASLRAEIETAYDAMKKREEAHSRAVSQREAQLQAREQAMRDERAAVEEEYATALRQRESELKARHDAALTAARDTFERERERLLETFNDQLQKISNLHLNSERELERMHRDKEREMAQRHRLSGSTIEDRENKANLQDVATKTQEALLSTFDSIEHRQRARASQLKAQMKAAASQGHTPGLDD